MLVFLALAGERLRLLVAAFCAAAGSAAAILVLDARSELADGILTSDVIHSQGRSAAVLIGVICVLTALAYGFVSRFPIRAPQVKVPRVAVIAGVILLAAAAVVAANPSQRFEDFKQKPSNPFAATAGGSGASSTPSDPASSESSVIDSASSHLLSSGGNGRWQFWGAAVDEFETKPIAGRGPGSYEAWWAQHGSISYFTRHAHSHYLQTLGELGAIGLLLLLVFLLAPVAALPGRLRGRTPRERNLVAASAGLVAGFLVALGIDWIWELPVVAVVGVIAIALLVGPATLTVAEAPQERRTRSRRLRLAARAVVVVVALAVIAGQAIPLLAQDDLEVSRDRFAAADLDGARDAALEARDVQPWAASPHLQLALVEEAMGDLPAAREAVSEAIERDPLDWRLWLTAARIDEASGLTNAAEANLAKAAELNPRSPLFANR
jgi:NADH:ubiquinone oxidoreductase subunit 6 (subunit J)